MKDTLHVPPRIPQEEDLAKAQDPTTLAAELEAIHGVWMAYLYIPIPLRRHRGEVLTRIARHPNTPPPILQQLATHHLWAFEVLQNPVVPLLLLEDPAFFEECEPLLGYLRFAQGQGKSLDETVEICQELIDKTEVK